MLTRSKNMTPLRILIMSQASDGFSWGRSLLSVRFLLAQLILAAAAAGLRPGLQALAQRYEKEPVAIRRPLREFDVACLPSFRDSWEYTHYHGPAEELGTDEFVHILFTKKQPPQQPRHAELFVTYYADPREKVPHTPEVCSRQAGAVVTEIDTITIETPQLAPRCPRIKARLIILREQTYNLLEVYFFCVEDLFRHTRNQVRWVIGKPGHRGTYFCKIDVAEKFALDGDPTQALETCKTLIREALPVLMAQYFPLENQIK